MAPSHPSNTIHTQRRQASHGACQGGPCCQGGSTRNDELLHAARQGGSTRAVSYATTANGVPLSRRRVRLRTAPSIALAAWAAHILNVAPAPLGSLAIIRDLSGRDGRAPAIGGRSAGHLRPSRIDVLPRLSSHAWLPIRRQCCLSSHVWLPIRRHCRAPGEKSECHLFGHCT